MNTTSFQTGITKILPVPYFTQPTSNTCQSTCLKMMARYLEKNILFQSTIGGARAILDIWKDINESQSRPVKIRNAHANMKWWLESHFPSLKFEYHAISDRQLACEKIMNSIDFDMPVLVSVSHTNVSGHIILIVGYENFVPVCNNENSEVDFRFVVHDPFGQFDPSLRSRLHGKNRQQGGATLWDGSESAPGQFCRLPATSVRRHRAGDPLYGTYYLIFPRR